MSVRASLLFALAALPLSAASIQTINPEEIGLSSERLQRVHEAVQRHIDAHDISGAVTVVARKGRLAQLEAHGLMDIDSKKAMSKDGTFHGLPRCPKPSDPQERGHSDAYGRGQKSGLPIRYPGSFPNSVA